MQENEASSKDRFKAKEKRKRRKQLWERYPRW